LSDILIKQSAFQSDTIRAEEEQAKAITSFQDQNLLNRVSALEEVPGT
jgi:hypothetical protein